jgi:hypothetical protein
MVTLLTAGSQLIAQQLIAQQVDSHSAGAPEKTNPSVPQAQQNEAQMPASGEVTTRDAKTFTGWIVRENGQIVLKDLVTKVSYKLSDTTKAKQYMGRQVKATGKLDMNTNTILLQRIVPAS